MGLGSKIAQKIKTSYQQRQIEHKHDEQRKNEIKARAKENYYKSYEIAKRREETLRGQRAAEGKYSRVKNGSKSLMYTSRSLLGAASNRSNQVYSNLDNLFSLTPQNKTRRSKTREKPEQQNSIADNINKLLGF